MSRILVAYATKLGSTREVAETIAEDLRAAGHQVDVLAAGQVRARIDHDAVILGSALYAATWLSEANKFVQRHLAELQARPVWLFSTGPLDPRLAASNPPITRHAAEATSAIGARGHVTFGGRLAADAPVTPQVLATHTVGDFRNWEAVHAWARAVAAEVAGLVGR